MQETLRCLAVGNSGLTCKRWILLVGSGDFLVEVGADTVKHEGQDQVLTCCQISREEQAQHGCHERPQKLHTELQRMTPERDRPIRAEGLWLQQDIKS